MDGGSLAIASTPAVVSSCAATRRSWRARKPGSYDISTSSPTGAACGAEYFCSTPTSPHLRHRAGRRDASRRRQADRALRVRRRRGHDRRAGREPERRMDLRRLRRAALRRRRRGQPVPQRARGRNLLFRRALAIATDIKDRKLGRPAASPSLVRHMAPLPQDARGAWSGAPSIARRQHARLPTRTSAPTASASTTSSSVRPPTSRAAHQRHRGAAIAAIEASRRAATRSSTTTPRSAPRTPRSEDHRREEEPLPHRARARAPEELATTRLMRWFARARAGPRAGPPAPALRVAAALYEEPRSSHVAAARLRAPVPSRGCTPLATLTALALASPPASTPASRRAVLPASPTPISSHQQLPQPHYLVTLLTFLLAVRPDRRGRCWCCASRRGGYSRRSGKLGGDWLLDGEPLHTCCRAHPPPHRPDLDDPGSRWRSRGAASFDTPSLLAVWRARACPRTWCWCGFHGLTGYWFNIGISRSS